MGAYLCDSGLDPELHREIEHLSRGFGGISEYPESLIIFVEV